MMKDQGETQINPDGHRDQIPACASLADRLTELEEAASHYKAILETTIDAIITNEE